jgi:hypothetical protein
MSTDEGTTPDELEQRQSVRPEEDDLGAGTTHPEPLSAGEADEADVLEQSQAVPEDDEEERG